jgi:type IV secretory pathway TrbL component
LDLADWCDLRRGHLNLPLISKSGGNIWSADTLLSHSSYSFLAVQFRYADTHALLMGHAARVCTIMPGPWQLKKTRGRIIMIRKLVIATLLAAGVALSGSVLAQAQATQSAPASAAAPAAASSAPSKATDKATRKADKAAKKAASQAEKAKRQSAKQAAKAAKQVAKANRQKAKAALPPNPKKSHKKATTTSAPAPAKAPASAPASSSSAGV